jgi:hypothetical protein
MPISDSKIRERLPSELNVVEVGHIVRRFFCKPLRTRGSCRQDCTICHKNLDKVFIKIASEDVNNPYTFLTYLCRQEVGEIIEQWENKTQAVTNWRETNPFDTLQTQI